MAGPVHRPELKGDYPYHDWLVNQNYPRGWPTAYGVPVPMVPIPPYPQPKESDKMTSVYRVRFVLPRKYYTDDNRQRGRRILEDAFGITSLDIEASEVSITDYGAMGLKIVCTAQQFAKYMVLRNDAGVPNGFKDLSPKLLPPLREFNHDPTLVVTGRDK